LADGNAAVLEFRSFLENPRIKHPLRIVRGGDQHPLKENNQCAKFMKLSKRQAAVGK
jgi:hypothetical protein